MTIHSQLVTRGYVRFPDFTRERVYMLPFRLGKALPPGLERWQGTVDTMTHGVRGEVGYLMVDQASVPAGQHHRRPGLHVDGNWIPALQAHNRGGGHQQGSHYQAPATHKHPDPGNNPPPFTHGHGAYYAPELIVLASNVEASRAIVGRFEGQPGPGGECAHLDVSRGLSQRLLADTVYVGNVTMVHETLALDRPVDRTLVRINVPNGVMV
jgi:hypothetical protein